MTEQIQTISLMELLNQGRIISESGEIPQDLVRILSNGAGNVEITCSGDIVLNIHGKILYPNEHIEITYQSDYVRRKVNGSGVLIIQEGFKYIYAVYNHPKEGC